MGIISKIREEVKEEMKEKENDRGILDIITAKMISRKFLVWTISTIFLGFGKIDADNWVAITLGYVGVEGFADVVLRWKENKWSGGQNNG